MFGTQIIEVTPNIWCLRRPSYVTCSYLVRSPHGLVLIDAGAVIGERVRFMARPVTMDLAQARLSMLKCLQLDIEVLCPGHRQPLTRNVRQACHAMRAYLEQGSAWPLLG
jgi:glyoxylase-like metal-dependent hydrolase (beta-lactamase superfamily II)